MLFYISFRLDNDQFVLKVISAYPANLLHLLGLAGIVAEIVFDKEIVVETPLKLYKVDAEYVFPA